MRIQVRSEIENESALMWGFVIAWLTVGTGYLAINAIFVSLLDLIHTINREEHCSYKYL